MHINTAHIQHIHTHTRHTHTHIHTHIHTQAAYGGESHGMVYLSSICSYTVADPAPAAPTVRTEPLAHLPGCRREERGGSKGARERRGEREREAERERERET